MKRKAKQKLRKWKNNKRRKAEYLKARENYRRNTTLIIEECLSLLPKDINHPAFIIKISDIFLPLLDRTIYTSYLDFKNASFDVINTYLEQIDWFTMENFSHLDDCMYYFYSHINSLITRFVPIVVKKTQNNFPYWVDNHTRSLIVKKKKLIGILR